MDRERTLVAGAGLMGHGIAQALAATGRHVALYEPDLARATAGRDRIAGNLERSVAKGRMTRGGARRRILGRIEATDDLAAAARRRSRRRGGLRGRRRSRRGSGRSSTGSRRPARSSRRTPRRSRSTGWRRRSSEDRRTRFVGMHFFSPVPVMPLVEVIRGSATSDATDGAVRALAARHGQAGDRLGRPAGLHRQPDPHAVPRRGDARLRAGRRRPRRTSTPGRRSA